MSIKNYTEIINTIESFAIAHQEIARFKVTFLSKIEGFANEEQTFPILFLTPASIVNQRYTNIYAFNIYVLDKIDNNGDNEIAILNSTQNILRDLAVWIKESNNNLELSNEPQIMPLENYLVNGFIGWQGEFQITAGAFSNDCVIPLNN